jgi:glycosyltransferase involved in cell wall biosynthesis
MVDIAEILSEGLRENGFAPEILFDQLPAASDHVPQVVIAPHEYVPLFATRALSTPELEERLRYVHVLNVEQPGSQWFEPAFEAGRRSRGVFDISPDGAREFRRRGVPAHVARLGYASRLEHPSAIRHQDRSIDILFLGHNSRRREDFFARHADLFSRFRCHINLLDVDTPRRADTAGYYADAARLDLLARSRILLNIHSSDRTYFETHRALLALANGCLLVTETSRDTAPLVNGEHFVMETLDELPARCAYYLENPESLERVATQGREQARTAWHIRNACRPLVAALTTNGTAATATVPTAPNDPSDDERLRREVLARLALARTLAAQGTPELSVVENSAYRRSAAPSVSVVVSLHNYGRFIEQSLASVTTSEAVPGGMEIVVVDDASEDDSVARVERFVDQTDVPSLLVKKRINTGLADTRNTGLELARGTYVFVLDADNWIYPACLRRLYDTLTCNPAAAAYGMLRRFDDRTGEPAGLISTQAWNVRSLVRGPYIDAMAMFDREKVRAVGGYSTELIEYGWFGWEDYDLWLKLAQAGDECRFVPEILSSYRVHPSSMIHRTNRSTDGIAQYLRTKFRDLDMRFPELDRSFGFPKNDHRPAPPDLSPFSVETDRLQRRCTELTRELEAVYASKSWRITRPLRLILDVFLK